VRAAAAVLALWLLVPSLAWGGGLPKEKERALRELLARLVAEPDARARKTLAASAEAVVGDAPLADAVAAIRKGPLYPAGPPKPRKVAGKKEELTSFGNVVSGYAFEHGGAVYRYAVDVPRTYDPSAPTGLLVDPGHGKALGLPEAEKAGYLAMWRRFADQAGHAGWLVARTEIVEQVGGGGARGELPEDEVAQVFDAFFRDVFSRFHVDPDRVYASGLSQTGFWAWYLGTFRADRFAGIAPMSAVTFHVDRFAGNLLTLPVYVLHGDADPTCAVDQPRRTFALLRRIGVDVRYREIAGGGHGIDVWQNLPEGLEWLGGKARERRPKRVSKSLRNTSGPWCAWIRVDAVEEEGKGQAEDPPSAGVDAEVEGQTVRIHGDRVKALTLCLSGEMLDLGKPVTVVWNGKRVHEGVVEQSLATLLEIAGEKCDWSATYEAAIRLDR
jgi:dienelactone hydrolase